MNHEIDNSLFYHKPFKELIWKNEISLALSWENSCALFLKYEFGATLFYHLRFKEFLEKRVFEEECRKFWTLESFVSTSPHLNLEVVEFEKHKVHSSIIDRGYGITRDEHENVEILQEPVTKLMARKIEEKNKGEVALFEKMI
ncbi:hypothetical protein M9H77_30924 [Catharanthus roseus]|uniref:Uncharacterized protein n=1 Tax=Catharanthus roseus TaxID=4058 RepID=A0ACB9ZZX8_CATRO|nr:hypothetical protein M9H77_30924 [Catharanthus roseus]